MPYECIKAINSNIVLVGEVQSKSVNAEIHGKFCRLLSLDASLHHTCSIPPTIPSALHISHHDVVDLEQDNHEEIYWKNVTFHAPLKPNMKYTASKYHIDDLSKVIRSASGPAYLSVMHDADGKLLSSILISKKE